MGFGGGQSEILGCHDGYQCGVMVLWVDLGSWGSKSRFSLDAEKTMGTMDFVGKMNLGSWGSRSRFSLDAEKMMGTMDFDGKMNLTWVRENDGIGALDWSGRGRFA